MIRILHVITTINRGGAENQLLVLVREQVKSGLEVSVLYLKGDPELEQDLSDAGANVVHDIANLHPFFQFLKMRSIAKSQKALLHAHLPRAELVARFASARNPFVVSRHNAEQFFPGAPQFLSSFLSRLVTDKAKHVIAISYAVSDFISLKSEVSDIGKITVVHYGYLPSPNVDRLNAKVELGGESKICIGTISRLTRQKDLPTLFTAFAKFLSLHPSSVLLIVGGGEEKNSLVHLAEELGIAQNIEWVGRTSEIQEYLSRMDVFVLSSLYEGFGLVLLEAMDGGVPVIASDNSAIPEVLGADFPGLARTGDVQNFLEQMNYYLETKNRRHILQIQNVRLGLFKADLMCSRIVQIYEMANYGRRQ
jgi:glycosyltransferase involved in cell wall biosynthesis